MKKIEKKVLQFIFFYSRMNEHYEKGAMWVGSEEAKRGRL